MEGFASEAQGSRDKDRERGSRGRERGSRGRERGSRGRGGGGELEEVPAETPLATVEEMRGRNGLLV